MFYNRAFESGTTNGKMTTLLNISVCSMEMGRWGDVDTANNKLNVMAPEDPMYALLCSTAFAL